MKQVQMNVSDTYDAALYLRLSKDDTDIDGSAKTESNSIGIFMWMTDIQEVILTVLNSNE